MSADDTQAGETAWTATLSTDDKNECENCGYWVSAKYRRHHGDENGDIHRCPNCSTVRERVHGLATDPDREVRHGQTDPHGGPI